MQEFLLKNALLQERPPLVHNNIEQEFLSLPQYRVKEPPEHLRPFARHPDVWCYEHNRYISPHDPHFWIDASVYENGFIATMGPLDGTDFE
nr:hypothetical protein [Chlamydiota bacterium]